jgi:hypothetical protein
MILRQTSHFNKRNKLIKLASVDKKKFEIGNELKIIFFNLCYIFGIGICETYTSREDTNSRTERRGKFISRWIFFPNSRKE